MKVIAESSNLDQLTQKIYREGIEKAEQDAREIINKARSKAEQTLTDAEAEAEKIIQKAEKENALLRRSTESEIKIKSRQLISDLKKNISSLITHRVLDQNIKGVFSDEKFFKTLILEIAKQWNPDEDIELVIPNDLEEKFSKSFEKSIRQQTDNLTITHSKALKNGFKIVRKDNTYQISFTEADFIELFKLYLEERTRNLLFEES